MCAIQLVKDLLIHRMYLIFYISRPVAVQFIFNFVLYFFFTFQFDGVISNLIERKSKNRLF